MTGILGDTNILEHAGLNYKIRTQLNKRVEQYHPLGRLGTAPEVAEAIAFLAGARASEITGNLLTVDGGYHAASPL